jgi:hypothetical protein
MSGVVSRVVIHSAIFFLMVREFGCSEVWGIVFVSGAITSGVHTYRLAYRDSRGKYHEKFGYVTVL